MRKFTKSITRYSQLVLGAVLMLAVSAPFITSEAQTKKKSGTMRKTTRRAQTSVPVGTQMKIRLETEIDTKKSEDGDRFTAIVLTPQRYADATIEGHVAKINKSGKMTGRTELSLAFDRITTTGGQRIPMAAQVVRIYDGSSKNVDEEGNVRSGSQGKETAIRTGGGAALGAIIGGVAGGGKGAAIGAAVGAGAGAGSTFITGSKKVKLESGTEILIRTTR